MPGCFALGWNPIKSVVTVAISSCWSETCDWQTRIFFFKEIQLLLNKHRLLGRKKDFKKWGSWGKS